MKNNSTPLQAIHRHCVSCVEHAHEVKDCQGDKMIGGQGDKDEICYLFPYREGRGRATVKTIRKFCLECMGGNRALVTDCPSEDCTLFPYRFGKNPNRAGIGNKNAVPPSVSSRLKIHERLSATG